MSKNLIPQIAHMLGVELGEEFKIKGYDGLTYKLTDNGLELTTVDGQKTKRFDNGALNSLLKGKMEIVKLLWKPKEGDIFYSFDFTYDKWGVKSDKWGVKSDLWAGVSCDYALLDKGWVYRTKEEAESALPRVAAEFGVEYEL